MIVSVGPLTHDAEEERAGTGVAAVVCQVGDLYLVVPGDLDDTGAGEHVAELHPSDSMSALTGPVGP